MARMKVALVGIGKIARDQHVPALAASGEEQVALCDFAAHASRMTGGKAEARQLAALRDLIGSSEGAVADAAGRLYGSLDGGSAEAVKLITGK